MPRSTRSVRGKVTLACVRRTVVGPAPEPVGRAGRGARSARALAAAASAWRACGDDDESFFEEMSTAEVWAAADLRAAYDASVATAAAAANLNQVITPCYRGGVCGVCNATWSVGDTWSRGNGKWACFSCQVYICSFECLNEHNMNNVGNTVEPGKKIYEHRHEMEEDGPPRQRK
jgi:hypothetical protein